ncbi:hypothetical protein [Oerskovia flava]|uniref:hypothetical protein n=1 Tax=Oerskovia flava TaxID=2986422 RepID=UPI00224006C9|nr:hypothetical protein [Oerskovia sp. JB1-3-2]
MSTSLSAIALITLAVATLWTAWRSRGRGPQASLLPLGLALVSAASALRVPGLYTWVQASLPPGTHEVAKHVLLVSGCLAVAAWVRGSLTSSVVKARTVVVLCAVIAASMTAVFVANGPWTTDDLDAQMVDRPWMVAYWALYYGTFVLAVGAFGWSAFTAGAGKPLRQRWGLDVAALGALVAVAWAIISVIALVLHEPGSLEPYLVLGIRTRYLILASSVLAPVGIVAHLAISAGERRRRRRDLGDMHAHLVGLSDEVRLDGASSKVVDYRRQVEILDAIAVLRRCADDRDRETVRNVIPDASPELELAYRLDIAAARRDAGAAPEQPATDDWGALVSDDTSLARLGRVFRDEVDEEARRDVLAAVDH